MDRKRRKEIERNHQEFIALLCKLMTEQALYYAALIGEDDLGKIYWFDEVLTTIEHLNNFFPQGS